MEAATIKKLTRQLEERDETIIRLKQIVHKGKNYTGLTLLVSIGMFFALVANGILMYRDGYAKKALKVQPVETAETCPAFNWPVLDFNRNDLMSRREKIAEASRLFQRAATFSGEKGEGRQGWLHLLAAYSYDPRNLQIVSNLFDNYEALNYGSIGYSTLLESRLSKQDRDMICPREKQTQYESQLIQTSEDIKQLKIDPGEGDTTLMFTTAVSRWNMTAHLPAAMNEAIYRQSVAAYEQLKRERPHLSATDLNHAFFRVQMADLDTSSSYWGPFKDIPGFVDLVNAMRRCVLQFLRDRHGWSEGDALRKASHPLVVWVSVHTAQSEHQPHVTEDALVGGVYYVSVPPGSGKLHMFDPRGKHPLLDLVEPTSPPNPPFHRIVSLAPAESMLVLFPGWLVHSVGKPSASTTTTAGGGTASSGSSDSSHIIGSDGSSGKYRVSLSLNLKGEWMDTASAAFGVPTY